jgi:redox-sensitive bicupin YhaK (pirin superfamily)
MTAQAQTGKDEKKLAGISRHPLSHWVGDGFPVRNVLSVQRDGARISPFLLLDYAGPRQFGPASEPRGVGEHPHRGFETVTVVYQGEVEHRDSAGNHGSIGPGDVQWMTAASGVLHEEFHSHDFTREGGVFEAVQLWVNLPARDKMGPPRYQTLLKSQIPEVELPEGAGRLRVIAGEYAGHAGPAQTFTPVNVWDLRVKAGSDVELQLPAGSTALLVVLHGRVRTGDNRVGEAQAAHFTREGERVRFTAETDSVLMLLGGEPINEPIASYGPFVMNSTQEIEDAIDDFQGGRFGVLRAGG